MKLFLYEVKQQQQLSVVRTFLKVYSTISLEKLATYMEVDESTLKFVFFWLFLTSIFNNKHPFCVMIKISFFLTFYRTILMTYKHKTHSVGADGKTISNADIDFYIDNVSFLPCSYKLLHLCQCYGSLSICRTWFMWLNPRHPSDMVTTFCVKFLRFVILL